jgi:hypothetical protein
MQGGEGGRGVTTLHEIKFNSNYFQVSAVVIFVRSNSTAGDYVKFGFPMAFTATILAWSMLRHASAYRTIGEWEYAKENLKWATDYFLKVQYTYLAE